MSIIQKIKLLHQITAQRYSKTIGSIMLCVMMGLSFCLSCEPVPARIDLLLYYPIDQKFNDLYNKIKIFNVAIRGEVVQDKEGNQSQFAPNNQNVVLPSVRCIKDNDGQKSTLEVEVIGFSDDEATVSYASGRQLLYHSCGKPRSIPVMMSPIDSFFTLVEYVSENTEQPYTRASQMFFPRVGHSVARLPDGRLLITGGGNLTALGKFDDISNQTEIFNPETGSFVQGPNMSSQRVFHTSTVVGNHVFVIGGLNLINDELESVAEIDIFSLDSDGKLVRKPGPRLTEPRAFHSATLTPKPGNPDILIYGGAQWMPNASPTMVTRWEIINSDPSATKSSSTGDIPANASRIWHTATLLENGRTLIVGGAMVGTQGTITSDSIFEVAFTSNDYLELKIAEQKIDDRVVKLAKPRLAHTATIANNRLIISGGMVSDAKNVFIPKDIHKTIEHFNASGRYLGELTFTLVQPRVFHSASLVEDGSLVIFGGIRALDSNGKLIVASQAEIYHADEITGIRAQPRTLDIRKNRFLHTATNLPNGSILFLGGADTSESDNDPPLASLRRGEIYNPGPRQRSR